MSHQLRPTQCFGVSLMLTASNTALLKCILSKLFFLLLKHLVFYDLYAQNELLMSVPTGAAVAVECQRQTVLQVSPCGSRERVGHQLLLNHVAAVDLLVTDHPTLITFIASGILSCVLRGFAEFFNYVFLTWTETSWVVYAMLKGFKTVRLFFSPF